MTRMLVEVPLVRVLEARHFHSCIRHCTGHTNLSLSNGIKGCNLVEYRKPIFLISVFYLYNCYMKTQRDTPQWLADKFALNVLTNELLNLKKVSVLEPSAGTGILVDTLTKKYKLSNLEITCVELNAEKCEVLKSKGYNTIHGDFLKTNFDKKFDIILAAPPFIKNVDVTHIEKMYSLLEHWGTLITLTTPYWTINNEPHQVAFREFLKDKKYSIEMLPDNTFIEKGKTVPTAILTMHKD